MAKIFKHPATLFNERQRRKNRSELKHLIQKLKLPNKEFIYNKIKKEQL